jgi:hypothetical protein
MTVEDFALPIKEQMGNGMEIVQQKRKASMKYESIP